MVDKLLFVVNTAILGRDSYARTLGDSEESQNFSGKVLFIAKNYT